MNESSSWASLKSAIQQEAASRMHSVHIVRVESLVGVGIFDCCLCYRGVTVWMEGKYLQKFPLREGSLVKCGLSEYQEVFGMRRLLAGGVSFLWLHVGFNRVAGRKVGVANKDREGMVEAEDNTRGWYLVEFVSTDLIRGARLGLDQVFMGSCRFEAPRALAVGFLDRLDHMVSKGQE